MKYSMIAVLMLAGCAGAGQTVSDIGPKPANWREAAKAHTKNAFFDPYSIRDAEISEPVPASMVFDGVTPIPHSGWMVCVRANAKNRFGAYTGRQLTGFLFVNGQISVVLDAEYSLQTAQHCGNRFSEFSI